MVEALLGHSRIMGILDVFELVPHLRDLEGLKISELNVEPMDTPLEKAKRVMIPVCAIRFTHDTVDGRAIFRHNTDGESLDLDNRMTIFKSHFQKVCKELDGARARAQGNERHWLTWLTLELFTVFVFSLFVL